MTVAEVGHAAVPDTDPERSLSQERQRRFNKFGEERKEILLCRTAQVSSFIYRQSTRTTARSLDQLCDTLEPLAIFILSEHTMQGHRQSTWVASPQCKLLHLFFWLYSSYFKSITHCIKYKLHFKTIHQKHQQSSTDILKFLSTNYDIYVSWVTLQISALWLILNLAPQGTHKFLVVFLSLARENCKSFSSMFWTRDVSF